MRKFIPLFTLATAFLLVTVINLDMFGRPLYTYSEAQEQNNNSYNPYQSQNGNPATFNQYQRNDVGTGTLNENSPLMTPKPTYGSENERLSVVQIAIQDPNLSTLVEALKAADLVSVLEGQGPYTIFAPSNAAFAKLNKETLANLLKPENREKLREILKYHVVPGTLLAADIKSGTVFTLNGKAVNITLDGKEVKVNDAKVIKADIQGTNGVIHIIDTVLQPR